MNAIFNVKLLRNNCIQNGSAIIYDSKIVDIIDQSELNNYKLENVIDGKGMYLSPGFIDIHIHGCSSYDVMDEDDDNLKIMSRNLVSTGVTSFLPTTMTMKDSAIERALVKIKGCMGFGDGAEILGANLEGPFISREFKGAHNENYIVDPNVDFVEKYKDIIKIITLAPELKGSMEFIRYCSENKIIVSIGHTGSDFELVMKAVDEGAKHFTHTFNAMKPLNHRAPGTVGAAMASNTTCELIADNIHVHPAVQQILINAKGYKNVVLITDAMRACLMGDGAYNLGGQEVIVKGNEARLKDGTLAGSVLTLNSALRNIIANTDIPISNAIDMITKNPAQLLNISDSKGTLDVGKDSDMAVFDDKFEIYCTFVRGKLVYIRN